MSALHTPVLTPARPLDLPAIERELAAGPVTIRVSRDDEGTQWLALDTAARVIGVPVTDGLRAWLAAALIETAP